MQSKLYFAKEELMADFPEYNISKYNPGPRKPPPTPETKSEVPPKAEPTANTAQSSSEPKQPKDEKEAKATQQK